MSIVAFAVAGGVAALTVRDGGAAPDELWPYVLAGLLAPGASQIFFTAAVAAAGPLASRSSSGRRRSSPSRSRSSSWTSRWRRAWSPARC